MDLAVYPAISINLIADQANIRILENAAIAIGEDVASRIRQIVSKAQVFMEHANRTTLTCNDINRALKWSDYQPLFGYECKPNEEISNSFVQKAQVFIYDEEIMDLEAKVNQEMPVLNLEKDNVEFELWNLSIPKHTSAHKQ